MSTDAIRETTQQADPRIDPGLRRIGDALTGLRYGSVLAIVQDGVIVQIERTEKTRLDKPVPVTPSRR
ncbi:MAG: YezD family protein [Planctomycetia bacterium]